MHLAPDCSVCSRGYSASLSFTCRECSDETVGLIIATVLVMMACVVGFAVVSYLISAEGLSGGRGIIGRVTQWIPMQSVKTVIIVWQILTQVRPTGRTYGSEPENMSDTKWSSRM